MPRSETSLAAERVARASYGKLIAYLAARIRDVAGAEDALSEAFAAALAEWPERGVPDKPEAWLMTVARRRIADAARRRHHDDGAQGILTLLADEIAASSELREIPDDRLRLMFTCAHPAIEASVRAPLILQTVLGFDAATIASAFLVSPAAMAQRLVRAKAKIRQAGIPFQEPGREDLPARLDAVLDAIYAAFAEGWTDATGSDARARNLAEEGIWLGRLMAQLMPQEPEVLGLLALMLHAEARRSARRSAAGDYIPLDEQNVTQWDKGLIAEAEDALRRACRLGALGRFQLQAAIQSAHAARAITGATDWPAIVGLYDALLEITQSPVVAINRAIAIAHSGAPAEGLWVLNALTSETRLETYQPYWAARAELLVQTNRQELARVAYERAIGLETDPAVRKFLQRRRAGLSSPTEESADDRR